MDDYIERETALKALCADCCAKECDKELRQDYHNISVLPAADVRPVVTCEKCAHNNACLTQAFVDDCGKVPLDRSAFFCADGERRS